MRPSLAELMVVAGLFGSPQQDPDTSELAASLALLGHRKCPPLLALYMGLCACGVPWGGERGGGPCVAENLSWLALPLEVSCRQVEEIRRGEQV